MSRARKVLIATLAVGLLATLLSGTFAALSGTTSNGGNSFSAGSVSIQDNDAGASMLSLPNAHPGDSTTGCILITYTGSLDATVRLYASVSGSLASYLTVTVTRGTGISGFNCTGFTADATDYNGVGAGVIYSGSLASFPNGYTAGVVDPKSASPETWSQGEAHAYKFVVSLDNDNAAQGLTATATFTWEARNQ